MAEKSPPTSAETWSIYVLDHTFLPPRWLKRLKSWKIHPLTGSVMHKTTACNVFTEYRSPIKKLSMNTFTLRRRPKREITALLAVHRSFSITMNCLLVVPSSTLTAPRFTTNLLTWFVNSIVFVDIKKCFPLIFSTWNFGRLLVIILLTKKISLCGRLKVKVMEWNQWTVQATAWCLITKSDHSEISLLDLLILVSSTEMKSQVPSPVLPVCAVSNRMMPIYSVLLNLYLTK